MNLGNAAARTIGLVGTGVRTASQYLPGPTGQSLGFFGNILSSVKGLTTDAAGVPTSMGSNFDFGSYAELLTLQIEVQQQMAAVSMVSNIEKSKHETKMAAVRNIRIN